MDVILNERREGGRERKSGRLSRVERGEHIKPYSSGMTYDSAPREGGKNRNESPSERADMQNGIINGAFVFLPSWPRPRFVHFSSSISNTSLEISDASSPSFSFIPLLRYLPERPLFSINDKRRMPRSTPWQIPFFRFGRNQPVQARLRES